MDLIEKVEFASAFSFKYSARPGTPAAELENQIPEAVKAERLLRLQTRSSTSNGTRSIAKWSGACSMCSLKNPAAMPARSPARSPYLQPVQMEGSLDRIGEIVRVEIVAAGANSLFGRLLPDQPAREALR